MLLTTPIKQIMKDEVVSLNVDQSILDAIGVLSRGRFHHVPVVENKRLVGILSTVDIFKLDSDSLTSSSAALLAGRARVGDIMIKDVASLSERATVGDAAELLSSGDYHALPVMAGTGELIGIVTTTDLIAHMLDIAAEPELSEPLRQRLDMLERLNEAAQNFVDTGMSGIAREGLERAIHEARWAA
jgi:CBS domain-containing protein